MYNNPKQISDTLLEAMQIISDKNISKTEYGTTIQGNIVECKDPSIGKYLVKYQDSLMEAYSTSPSVQYPKNTSVYLFTTNGKLGEMKVILGSTKQLGSNYIEEFMGQEYYDTSNNFIEDDGYVIELCSYTSKEENIYEKDGAENLITLSDNIFQKLQNSNYLKISGTIETNLPYNQKYYGRYGIRITLLMKNSATGNLEEQDYYFDSNNFIGNPYEYRVPSTQSVSYPIDSANFAAVVRITTFVQGFPNQVQGDQEPPAADIFISNLTINGSYRLSETEKNTIGVILTAPKGYIFTKDNNLEDTRPIKAGLRARMKQVDLEAQGAQVYWFKEDLNINTMSPGYLRVGGLGWRCLNPASATDNPLVYQFEPSITIDIKKEDVQFTKESKFKCVIRYDNKSYTKQFIIFNNGASRQVTLESTAGTSFSCSAGHPNLICRIWETSDGERRDITKRKDKNGNKVFIFKWQVCNSQNVTKVLEQDSEERIQEYENDKAALRNINAILNGTEEPDDNKEYKETLKTRFNINKEADQIPYEEFIEVLQERIKRYESNQHIVENILYSLDLHQIIDYSIFKCSCYEGDTCYGTANITIKNTQIPNDGYVLAINNGDQVFLYDEEGTSLHSAGLDQPYSIRDLSFSLFHNGEEISQDDLKNGVAPTWKVPLKDTMLEIETTENSSDENYKYIIGQTLPIDVKNVYNPSLSNNDIYLILRYKDLVLTTKTNFGFSKEGELGTNGTKYQFKIATDTPVIKYNNINGEWEKNPITIIPELWCNGQKESIANIINWNILKNNLNRNKKNKLQEWSYFSDNGEPSEENENNRTINLKNNLGAPDNNLVNIIQATLTGPEGYKYYSVLPFVSIYEYFNNNNYQIQFNLDSGFRTAVYKSDGTQPKYDNRLPFEVNIYKKFNNGNERENITLQKKENFIFKWDVTDEEDLAGFKTDSVNKYRVEPKSVLKNGNRVTDGVLLYITKDGKPFTYVHIPIYLMLNRYENAAMNDWDGTSIEINEDGYILTPQIGAGTKDDDNCFTGVLLGTERVKTQNNEIKDNVGLLGYAAGARSIFLDAKTGNAQFGKAGEGYGKIIIDVSKPGEAVIKSNDYQVPSSDKNRTEDDKNKKGMQIQFSGDPHIYFSSGNFMVNSQGKITARGGGNIAGWNIEDDKLSNENVGMAPKNWIDNKNIYTGVFWAGAPDIETVKGKEKNIIQTINGNDFYQRNFFVTQGGYLFSKRGKIAGWNITEKRLYATYEEKNDDDTKTTYSVGMQSGNGTSFWAGPLLQNGDAKYNFYVKSNGYLFSKSGNIGGWDIIDTGLFSNDKTVGMSPGKINIEYKIENKTITRNLCFWGGKSTGKTTGEFNFWVSSDGYLFSRYGMIGNWYIGEYGLYQSPTKETKYDYKELTWTWNDKTKKFSFSHNGKENTKTTKKLIPGTDYTYKTSEGGIYIGPDGIRFGSLFYVDSGGLYAYAGEIGGITINQSGLSADNWKITGDGTAYFAGATINGSDIVKCSLSGSASGTGVSGGGMRMGSGGAGSSYMSPQVKTGPGENDKSWNDYIPDFIEDKDFWNLEGISCTSFSIGPKGGTKKSLTDYIKDVIDDDYVKAIINDAYIKEHAPKPASSTPTTP